MSKRRPVIAGNWKMHNLTADAKKLSADVAAKVETLSPNSLPEVILCPTFTSLTTVLECVQHNNKIEVGAQTLDWRESGAYTGEVSAPMLKDLGVKYAIIGHSERREYFGETDERVNNKIKAAIANGLIAIVCCGESLEQREQGITDIHIKKQIEAALKGINSNNIEKLIFAYEPIWAIGTGKTCDSAEANRVIKMIRQVIASLSNQEVANKVRILYGGSVKPNTIDEQMAQSDIDGALVGGASLKAEDFIAIIKGASVKISC